MAARGQPGRRLGVITPCLRRARIACTVAPPSGYRRSSVAGPFGSSPDRARRSAPGSAIGGVCVVDAADQRASGPAVRRDEAMAGVGLNWGVADHEPVIAYFDHPTSANFALLRTELRAARSMGANSMRIYLQLGQVMATATTPRARTLRALQRLLALAHTDHVYLDITGDLVWRPSRAPTWYARLPWQARWRVQARFWKAVAHAAATSPAVLCYELTSEPIVSPTPGLLLRPT